MKKIILLLSVFTLSGAFAQQDGAKMNEGNKNIVDVCDSEKGVVITFEEGSCKYRGCAYKGKDGEVKFLGHNERAEGSCNVEQARSKARAKYLSGLDDELAKKKAEIEAKKKAANSIGATRGGDGDSDSSSSSSSGNGNGNGNGNSNGNGNGNGNGNSNQSGSYSCEDCEGDVTISENDPCYKECRPRKWFLGLLGKSEQGLERSSCRKCLGNYPQLYSVKGSGKYAPKAVVVRGVSVKGGNGSRSGSGQVIISGNGNGNGSSNSNGNGSGGGGTIIVTGGGSGNSSANLQLPKFCQTSKEDDKIACANWWRIQCASSGSAAACMGHDMNDIKTRYESSSDCVDCAIGGRKQHWTSGVAEILGAIAPPLAGLGSAYFGYKAQVGSNKAWAGAAAKGFEQCQIHNNNYLGYLAANEMPGLTPQQQAGMNCNGFQLNGFGGLGGMGMGAWGAGGYSPGFMAGMMGPYGMQNPYGMGGINIGLGGMGGYPGMGYPVGMGGGLVNGISIAGGVAPGMTGGYPGGYVAGGYVAGGYPGGYAGGYPGGYATGGIGGYPGGYAGGYPAGAAGGAFVNGISLAGGAAAGMPGGYAAGGYPGGYASGGYLAGGGMNGGYPGGFPGGYQPGWGSGLNNGMYPGGMPGAGGYWGATGGWGGNPQADYMASSQASNYDRMLQQQGMSYQMGGMGTGMGMPYGQAAFSPLNAGFSMYGGVGF